MKKYFDENGNEIIVFEQGERGETGERGKKAPFPPAPPSHGPRGPLARFPWWSIYTPVVPCVYDGSLTMLELLSKLYYYANKLNEAINQNHDDIITVGERVDALEVAIALISEQIGDLPKFVIVEFDTAAQPITANHTFAEVLAEYQAGSIVIGRASADNALYIATVGDENAIVFLTPQPSSNITITMTPSAISQALTRYLTSGGGTVTGTLNILNTPVSDLNAANKAYVDAKAAAEAAAAAAAAAATAIQSANTYTNGAIQSANAYTDTAVNALEAEIKADLAPFDFNVTYNSQSASYSIDATFSQIAEAYDAKREVRGIQAGKIFRVVLRSTSQIYFICHTITAGYDMFIVNANNTVAGGAGMQYITGTGTLFNRISSTLRLLYEITEDEQAVNKLYVDTAIANAIRDIDLSDYLPLAGGTLTGQIVQPLTPTENRHLVNKRYVDSAILDRHRYTVGEETLIGEWVENNVTYDVYRKIIDFGALPNAGNKSVDHMIGAFYRFTRIDAIAIPTGTGSSMPIPLATVNSNANIYIGVGNARITIQTATDRSAFNAYVTLEYLKERTPELDVETEA